MKKYSKGCFVSQRWRLPRPGDGEAGGYDTISEAAQHAARETRPHSDGWDQRAQGRTNGLKHWSQSFWLNMLFEDVLFITC